MLTLLWLPTEFRGAEGLLRPHDRLSKETGSASVLEASRFADPDDTRLRAPSRQLHQSGDAYAEEQESGGFGDALRGYC